MWVSEWVIISNSTTYDQAKIFEVRDTMSEDFAHNASESTREASDVALRKHKSKALDAFCESRVDMRCCVPSEDKSVAKSVERVETVRPSLERSTSTLRITDHFSCRVHNATYLIDLRNSDLGVVPVSSSWK